MEKDIAKSESELLEEYGFIRIFILSVQSSISYNCIMIALAFVSIGLLLFDVFIPNIPSFVVEATQKYDITIAYVFLADFLLGFLLAFDKVAFLKNDWTNLLASIPISGAAYQSLRALRFERGIRALRFLRGVRMMESAVRIRYAMERNYAYVKERAVE